MTSSRPLRRLRIAAITVVFAAAVALVLAVAGLQRASLAQSGATISLDAPVSFPVDI